jgi:hypothetical protein
MGIARVRPAVYGAGMSDGKRFDQAVRALDKFIAEHELDESPPPELGEPSADAPNEDV